MAVLRVVWISLLVYLVQSETVQFRSSEKFTVVDPADTPDATEFEDPKNTGTQLFNGTNAGSKRLSLNILVSKWKSPSSDYFRAHPVFVDCAQQVITRLNNADKKVEIAQGYRTATDSSGTSLAEDYLRSGCGLQLKPKDGDTSKLEDIAATVLKVCPKVVERAQRNIGVIIMSDRVHFHMSVSGEPKPWFAVDGYTMSDVVNWAEQMIAEGLDEVATPECTNFPTLSNGDHYPPDTADEKNVVGTVDICITRNMTTDFARLVQYQGYNIEFENCPSDVPDNGLDMRCADRVMSTRMYNVINKLQKKIKDKWSGDKMKILKAWVEMEDPSDPLHCEGRAVKLQLTSGDSSRLGEVAQYAACYDADYIRHDGDALYLSVKRMKGSTALNAKKSFPSGIELLAVDIPSEHINHYKLPDVFPASEEAKYPVYDSSGKEDLKLAENTNLRTFLSSDYRYFRLDPLIAQCYSAIIYEENKRNKPGDAFRNVTVKRGFISNNENALKFDAAFDDRFNTHNLGIAMNLSYAPGTNGDSSPYRLMKTVINKCASIFKEGLQEMGLGLYMDSVFVDMRDTLEVWIEDESYLPEGMTSDDFFSAVEERYERNIRKKRVDPTNYEEACLLAYPPKPQNYDYKFEHSETTKRRRRSTPDPDQCVPTRNTDFCTSTLTHRQDVVDEIWSQLERKWFYHDKDEVQTALEGCFLDCGTCMTGNVWEDKLEHCNNFLHWINWKLLNDQRDVTNFFSRDKDPNRRLACDRGEHCIERSPLFSLVAPSVEATYRPDPTKSVVEELYSSADNPSPVFMILQEIYGIEALGEVKFWVWDDTDMTSLKSGLKTVMLYNPNVTNIVIYVHNYQASKDAAGGVVEKAGLDYTTTGCPEMTREFLTPYEIRDIPHDLKKRSLDPVRSRSEEMKKKHSFREMERAWAERNLYL